MRWVFDATPLIYFAKAERLDVIETLDGPRVVPESVHREVVPIGIERGYDDARRIERAVEGDLFEIVTVDIETSPTATRLERHPGLSSADIALLACAEARGAVAVIDETAGRSTADVEGIETRGTGYLVLSSVQRGMLSPEKGRETIDAMIDRGWYVAPEQYTKIVWKLEPIEK